MCLGGHLAYRCAFDNRVAAAVCYFATDIHSHSLGQGKNDDSLDRAGDIRSELVMVRFLFLFLFIYFFWGGEFGGKDRLRDGKERTLLDQHKMSIRIGGGGENYLKKKKKKE